MRHFLRTLPPNLLRCFAPRYLPWHVLAVVLTAVIVRSGLDWSYFVATKNVYLLFFPALIIGGLLPIILPLGLLVYGARKKKEKITYAGWLLAQAALLGSIVSSIYKTFTGRLQPNLHNYAVDISHSFQFGFFRHGIFWGWPSSHTTIAFSMAVALVVMYPKKRWLVYVALLYALYIGLGVSMSIHWLSDAVAGVILGSVVGVVVGRSFARYTKRP
ncbi:MAG: phosphoesterase PA-phosphatase related protein [Parcubacteria group bacterium]|nr:phosphoesterase PA-phosphatase related protein [Parcubacteria group bacterium]